MCFALYLNYRRTHGTKLSYHFWKDFGITEFLYFDIKCWNTRIISWSSNHYRPSPETDKHFLCIHFMRFCFVTVITITIWIWYKFQSKWIINRRYDLFVRLRHTGSREGSENKYKMRTFYHRKRFITRIVFFFLVKLMRKLSMVRE